MGLEMSATNVVELLMLLEYEGIFAWIDGGWAVDALLGEQTRLHNDLDLIVEEKTLTKLQCLFESKGYSVKWRRIQLLGTSYSAILKAA